MKINQRVEAYEITMKKLLEEIIIQPYILNYLPEEVIYINLGVKLKTLDIEKYYFMANMYDIMFGTKEEARLIQKKLDNYSRKLQNEQRRNRISEGK